MRINADESETPAPVEDDCGPVLVAFIIGCFAGIVLAILMGARFPVS